MKTYIYRERAVVFVDVLGFKEKLISFQEEALFEQKKGNKPSSKSANKFINTVKESVDLLDENFIRYYLFSDNLCITSDFESNPNILIDILFMLGDIFYRFAQSGYFLRGGIDLGWFIDEEDLAVGVPLATAYEMEIKKAIYPRILLSKSFVNKLNEFEERGLLTSSNVYSKQYLISESCEKLFLNPFFNVSKREDYHPFFRSLNSQIRKNLERNKFHEYIFMKYIWLAKEFNDFVDRFANEIIFQISEREVSNEDSKNYLKYKIEDYG